MPGTGQGSCLGFPTAPWKSSILPKRGVKSLRDGEQEKAATKGIQIFSFSCLVNISFVNVLFTVHLSSTESIFHRYSIWHLITHQFFWPPFQFLERLSASFPSFTSHFCSEPRPGSWKCFKFEWRPGLPTWNAPKWLWLNWLHHFNWSWYVCFKIIFLCMVKPESTSLLWFEVFDNVDLHDSLNTIVCFGLSISNCSCLTCFCSC